MKISVRSKSQRAVFTTVAVVVLGTWGCGETLDQRGRHNGGDLNPDKLDSSEDATGKKKNGGDGEGSKGNKGSSGNKDKGEKDKDGGTTLKELKVSAGLRNFDQINSTMSKVTGVPKTNQNVQTAFNNLSGSLPTGNNVKAFLGSHQVSVFKLSVEYCDALVQDTTLRAEAFGSLDFSATPAQAFDDAGKKALAKSLTDKFWGTGLSKLPDMSERETMVSDLVDKIMEGKDPNDATLTPAVATGVCTAVLSSSPVTMY